MTHRILFAAAAAFAGLAFMTAPAMADNDDIIVSPRVHHERIGRGPLGNRVERVSISDVVSARDLDLRSDYDVDVLHDRVHYTAVSLCDELDRELRGLSETSDRQCVRDAVHDARPQVEAMVDRARH